MLKNGPIIASLLIDEMSIMTQVSFDGKKYVGAVDKGDGKEEEDFASDSLVFMIVGVNQHFKIPVGYFLIKSMNADERANLVHICLEKLRDCGVEITSVTFDSPPVNQSLFKKLGGSLNPDALKVGGKEV